MINTQDLATRLRQETEALHLQAERSGYIREILRKRSSLEGYGLFLGNLEPAYAALEEGLRQHAGLDALAGFDWRSLFRHSAIVNDLSAIKGEAWRDAVKLLPEGQAYADHIALVRTTAPHRLLGHAYVRYIGDLSGGQIVKAILTKAPGLSDEMLTFYDFADIANAETFKTQFRDQLDRIGKTAKLSDDIVDETITAFRLNIDVSHAVEQAVRPTGT